MESPVDRRPRMSASVVIPAKNGADTIGACLDAVLSQDYDGDVDILVIDSGSTDGTVEEILARPGVRLHRIPPEAFDHGDTRNLGAGMTSGEAIVFLVQDAEPVDGNWLSALVANLENDPGVAGAFSRILPRPDANPLTMRSCEGDLCFRTERVEEWQHSPEEWAALDPHSLRLRCNFNNVSSVIRRGVWERLPLERGTFGEDIKFARAAIEAGCKIVFEPDSRVFHSHEYGPLSAYRRTRIDADLNMRYLGRPNIERLGHVITMTRQAVREDLSHLRRSAQPRAKRWASLLRSPAYRFAEFFGFWRGVKGAMRDGARAWVRAPAARLSPDRHLKVLIVVHGFPPESWAGVEVVACTLARALRQRGNEVVLFTRSPGQPGQEDRSLWRSEFDGLRVHRYTNRIALAGIDDTYRPVHPAAAFEQVFVEEEPDVVHVLHMIHLSTEIIDRCKAHGVPCVVELCDYWFRCARVQLIRPDQTNCEIPPPGLGCAACAYERTWLIDPLARLDRLLGPLPHLWARRVPQSQPPPTEGWQQVRENSASLIRREFWMREALKRADSLVVPSVTVKRALVETGVSASRVAVCEHGIEPSWHHPDAAVNGADREPGTPLRVGFVGSLIWYKGLLVAARAVASMPRGTAHLHVHGDHLSGPDPVAVAAVRKQADQATRIAGSSITFHGPFAHDELAAIYAQIDVLVVPSLWREAYGLTVREARLAGTPVVGSDIGGIAEGIRHDVDGLLFEAGNAESLRDTLQRLVDDPELGPRLVAAAPPVRTDAEEAREMEWRYRQVIGKSVAVT